MLIEVGTPEFDRLFKTADPWGQFESFLPAHDTYVAAMADPSLDPFAEVNVDLLNYQGVADIQRGTQNMATKILRPGGPEGTFGFLVSSTQALENIMQMPDLEEFMSPSEVFRSLGVAMEGQNPTQAIKDVAFAVGMTALGSMGPVGAAAAAIVGFTRAIVDIFRNRKEFREDQKHEALVEAYRSFPPLMEPRNNVDEDSVNIQLLPQLQTGDWTPLFSPRFSGDKWQAIPRKGGFALALGEADEEVTDPLGDPLATFKPSGGLGYWPGQNRITSVIQVALDPTSAQVMKYMKGDYTPRDHLIQQWMVRDTGDFLMNTNRLAAIAWEWVSRTENSPHLYKVSVPRLHALWADYCHKGLHALMDRDPASRDDKDLYMSALGCAVGTWGCWYDEGRYRHINGKLHGRDMGAKGSGRTDGKAGPKTWHPNRHPRQGCALHPIEATVGSPRCLGNIYDLQTKLVLDQVAQRQRWFLRHSLLCAYVRRSWAGFENKALRDLLDEMRMLLLEHPDRKFVKLDDVPPEEVLSDGRNFKAELKKRGVGGGAGRLALATSTGTLLPPKDSAPDVQPGGRMPFDFTGMDEPENETEGFPWRGLLAGAGVSALVGGGLYLWNRR